jgi:apolipoprotein N-acyltransferase
MGSWRWPILITVLGFGILLPSEFTSATHPVKVELLQGNTPQKDKFSKPAVIKQTLEWYAKHIKSSRADLVVTPETAIPLAPFQLPTAYLQAIEEQLDQTDRAALIGIPYTLSNGRFTNTVVGLGPNTAHWRYDKYHLVPFGEFIPLFFAWFVQAMEIPLDSFAVGAPIQPPFIFKENAFDVNICYEDLFSEELARRFHPGGNSPTILVNVSNMAWFATPEYLTTAIPQHLQIARMRALELQRPMLRAANTGATVYIDAYGKVVNILPFHIPGSLEVTVEGRTGLTPYAWWVSRYGQAPVWVFCFFVFFITCLYCFTRRPSQATFSNGL